MTYINWRDTEPNWQPNGGGCVRKSDHAPDSSGAWSDIGCNENNLLKKYACSVDALRSCNSSQAFKEMLRKRSCIKQDAKISSQELHKTSPDIDIFLNPDRVEEKKAIIEKQKMVAKHYFNDSDMGSLYQELFRILWHSTLPCFKEENDDEHMMLSCELAGREVNCSDIFNRVPTDIGMCCALNVEESLSASKYKTLVKEMQGDKQTRKVKSQEGRRNGLKLTLDLHSNTVSFATVNEQHNTFKMFIGQPAQFPEMRDKSISLQPGREHFVDLSATVVSTKGIRKILPEARGCLFTDEGNLEFYKRYTFSNCRLECQIREAEEKHGCIPWHLPRVSRPSNSGKN